MDHPAIERTLRTGYPFQLTRPTEYRSRTNLCECGEYEAISIYKGKQRLCAECLEGICEVKLL